MGLTHHFRFAVLIINELQSLEYTLLEQRNRKGLPSSLIGLTPFGRLFFLEMFHAKQTDDYETLSQRIVELRNCYPHSEVALGLITSDDRCVISKMLLEPLFENGIRLCYFKTKLIN
ncbi:hypothetical protein VME0621_02510 [Vibrio mediterranei]|jgi:hypothetical protein|nr:hypothetical protein C9980_05785 [Vibrio mediterranei]SBO10395.1 hypothetical protein VME0621_02510 [Vibrio mediterranei]